MYCSGLCWDGVSATTAGSLLNYRLIVQPEPFTKSLVEIVGPGMPREFTGIVPYLRERPPFDKFHAVGTDFLGRVCLYRTISVALIRLVNRDRERVVRIDIKLMRFYDIITACSFVNKFLHVGESPPECARA